MEQTQTLPFERPRTGRVLTGASTALANRTGLGRGWIRAGFVVSSLFAGFGLVAYAVATVGIRSEGEPLTPFQQWIARFDQTESVGQKLGWWILTALMLAAVATISFLQGPFVVLSLLVLGAWLASRPTARVGLETA